MSINSISDSLPKPILGGHNEPISSSSGNVGNELSQNAVVTTLNPSQNSNLIELNEAASRGLQSLGNLFASSENRNELVRQRTHQTAVSVMSSVRQGITSVTEKNLKLLEQHLIIDEQNKKKEAVHQEEIKELNEKNESLEKKLEEMREKLLKAERKANRLEHLRTFEPLEKVLLGISTPFNCLNGCLTTDFSPATINQMLSTGKPEANLGYFAKYLQEELKDAFPKTIDPEKLPNLESWMAECERYLTRLRENQDFIDVNQGFKIEDIAKVGDLALEFIEYARTCKPLFEKLLNNYQANLQKIEDMVRKALACEINKLATSFSDRGEGSNQLNQIEDVVTDERKGGDKNIIGEIICKNVVDKLNGRKNHDNIIDRKQFFTYLMSYSIVEKINPYQFNEIPNKPENLLISTDKKGRFLKDPVYGFLRIPVPSQTRCGLSDEDEKTGSCGHYLTWVNVHQGILNLEDNLLECISKDAHIAERLGLGRINFTYERIGSWTSQISILFNKNETCFEKTIEDELELNWPFLEPSILLFRCNISWILVPGRGFYYRHAEYGRKSDCYFALNEIEDKKNDISRYKLSALIDCQLRRLLIRALSSLYEPSDTGKGFNRCKDEIQSSYSILKTLLTVSGGDEEQFQEVSGLINAQGIDERLKKLEDEAYKEFHLLPEFPKLASSLLAQIHRETLFSSSELKLRNLVIELHQLSKKESNQGE